MRKLLAMAVVVVVVLGLPAVGLAQLTGWTSGYPGLYDGDWSVSAREIASPGGFAIVGNASGQAINGNVYVGVRVKSGGGSGQIKVEVQDSSSAYVGAQTATVSSTGFTEFSFPYNMTVYGIKVSQVSGGPFEISEIDLDPMPPTAPGAPDSVSVSNISDTGARASWPSVTGATGYKVQVGAGTVTDVGALTSYSFTGLTASTAYVVKVSAYNAVGESGQTSASFTTLATPAAPLPAPGNLAYSSVTTSGASLSWDAVADAVSYHVKVNGTQVGNPAGTSYDLSGLQASRSYMVSVVAVDAGGYEGSASSVSFTTASNPLPPAPASFAEVTNRIKGLFDNAKSAGLTIVAAAIGLGLIFLGARFAWNLLRRWLAKAG